MEKMFSCGIFHCSGRDSLIDSVKQSGREPMSEVRWVARGMKHFQARYEALRTDGTFDLHHLATSQ
jgi:hypothetical protein